MREIYPSYPITPLLTSPTCLPDGQAREEELKVKRVSRTDDPFVLESLRA